MAARQILRLFDLCEADGVNLTLLSGNHDPYLTDLRHLHLAAGLVFVTHGDVLHPAVAPWSPRAGRMRARGEAALAALPREQRQTLEARLAASQHASHADWDNLRDEAGKSSVHAMLMRPWTVAQVLWYWRRFPRLAAQFVQEHAPQARFALLGHTHRPGIWTIRGRTIINTGSFGFPGRPWAVTIYNDLVMSVLAIEDRRDTYALATRPIARYDLVQSRYTSVTQT
jgi:predicted phosphodiesterase